MLCTEVPSREAFSPHYSEVCVGNLRYLGQLALKKNYTRKDLWIIHIMGLYYREILGIRHFHMSHNPFRVGGQPVEEMYGIMTKISSVSSQNQLLMLKNAPEFTKIMIGEICTSL